MPLSACAFYSAACGSQGGFALPRRRPLTSRAVSGFRQTKLLPVSMGLLPSVTLRPAILADRERIWRWLARSDITADMIGPPDYPEHPVPDFDEFCEDYEPHFFTGSAPHRGRCFLIEAEGEVWGQVNYNDVIAHPLGRATELDIWLRGRDAQGRGMGPAAITALCNLLRETLDVRLVFIRPAQRNTRAVRAYQKAGFAPVAWDPAETQALFGPDDYPDKESAYLAQSLD